jgi:hypothetical protein
MLLLTATSFAADGLAGHYVLRDVHEVGSELLLKPNGTFEYILSYGAADFLAAGTWKVEGDSVVLTTVGDDKEPPFKLVHSATVEERGIRVSVRGPNGQPVPNIDVLLKTQGGEDKARTDGSGVAEFESNGAAKSVVFEVIGYDFRAGPYPLNLAHNEFQFEIHPEAITHVPFKGERLKIVGRTLRMWYWDHIGYWDPNTPMIYEKQ